MSVAGLSTSIAYVYQVTNGQDTSGALQETFTLKYSQIPIRIRYMAGRDHFNLVKFKISLVTVFTSLSNTV